MRFLTSNLPFFPVRMSALDFFKQEKVHGTVVFRFLPVIEGSIIAE